ncbi:trypsin-like peptidase domain-containing protein [bacterium]|nr:trypsin-like peptidase domain-containing protein [bacterium]
MKWNERKRRGTTILLAALLTISVVSLSLTVPAAHAQGDEEMSMQSRYPVVGSTFDSPFVAVAERLKPAVVYIKVVREREIQPLPFFDFHPFFGPGPEGQESEPRTQKVPSSGTGFIIDASGLVVTNNHVVDSATEIKVSLSDGSERDGEVIGVDPETDLALISIGAVPEDHVAPLGDSDAIRIGDWAIAMGNPMGLDWTLTVGVISAKGRSNLNIGGGRTSPAFQDFIQTDASINFGNSGGPLTNIHGEVIGINAAINTRAQNIGFAIPINLAKEVVKQLQESGRVSRGYLGMVPRELNSLMAEALNLDADAEGVFVESVQDGTPASDGGLAASDVIVEIDGIPVSEVSDFRFRVARHAPGDKMELTVLRDGKTKRLDFELGDRADYVENARDNRTPERGPEAWMGLSVTGLDSPMAQRARVQVEQGVLITKLTEESPANGQLRPGDVIVEVDKHRINSISDWREVTEDLGSSDRAILVKFHPQGRELTRYIALKKE